MQYTSHHYCVCAYKETVFSFKELDEIKQDLESKLGSEFQNKLQRARSLSESTSESEQPAAGELRFQHIVKYFCTSFGFFQC